MKLIRDTDKSLILFFVIVLLLFALVYFDIIDSKTDSDKILWGIGLIIFSIFLILSYFFPDRSKIFTFILERFGGTTFSRDKRWIFLWASLALIGGIINIIICMR